VIVGLQLDNWENLAFDYPAVTPTGVYFVGVDSGAYIAGNYIDGVKQPIVRSAAEPDTLVYIPGNYINHRNYSPGLSQPAAVTLVSPSTKPQREYVWNNIVAGDGGSPFSVTASHTP